MKKALALLILLPMAALPHANPVPHHFVDASAVFGTEISCNGPAMPTCGNITQMYEFARDWLLVNICAPAGINYPDCDGAWVSGGVWLVHLNRVTLEGKVAEWHVWVEKTNGANSTWVSHTTPQFLGWRQGDEEYCTHLP